MVTTPLPALLIVEDNPEQRMLLSEFLPEVLDCNIHQAADTATALSQLTHCRPDLILLDLHVPPHGGLAFLRLLRADPALARIPVIVLSGSHRTADVEEIIQMDRCRFIEKPYDLDVLEQAVLDCLPRCAMHNA